MSQNKETMEPSTGEKTWCQKSCGYYVRLSIASVICLVLAAVIVWALVPVYDPGATLKNLYFNLGKDISTMTIELEMTNKNRFRGFNYTTERDRGYIEAWYMDDENSTKTWWVDWNYTANELQGFGKTLSWNFTLDATYFYLSELDLLRTQKAHIYLSLYLTYTYKILFWTTQTNYYQWLDSNVYVDDKLKLDTISEFNQTADFTFALAT